MVDISSNILFVFTGGLILWILLRQLLSEKGILRKCIEELIITEDLEEEASECVIKESITETGFPTLTLEEKIELLHLRNDDLTFLMLNLSSHFKAIDKIEDHFKTLIADEEPSNFKHDGSELLAIRLCIVQNIIDILKICIAAGGDIGGVTWEMLDQEEIKTRLEKNETKLDEAQMILDKVTERVVAKKELSEKTSFNV